jgi:hypothetical protein
MVLTFEKEDFSVDSSVDTPKVQPMVKTLRKCSSVDTPKVQLLVLT